MALEPWRKGTVIRIEQQTHNTRRFWIQVPELISFDFKPGQFVTLDLDIHEKPNKRWRSYSIASWPNGTNIFELCIVLLPDGAGTNYLFNEVKEGTELTLRGPVGVFTLHSENLEKDLFLICTGTGIAPFRSMATHLLNNNLATNNIHLVFGCRKKDDLLYFDELTELAAKHSHFHYHPVLSREDWTGAKGYVHGVYESLLENKQDASFFLCGWKGMIDEARKRITDLGYDKKAVHVEIYG